MTKQEYTDNVSLLHTKVMRLNVMAGEYAELEKSIEELSDKIEDYEE